MRTIRELHRWDVTPEEAVGIQRRLRGRVRRRDARRAPRTVAGADIALRGDRACAAVVVLDYGSLEVREVRVVRRRVRFPYVPGLLSFREAPPLLAAWRALSREPDLLLVDGQGIAHPRRFGLAAHLGVVLDVPAVGCAKTRLLGTCREPAVAAGSTSDLRDGDELIGAVVRTRRAVKPVFVSIGHRVSLDRAVAHVLHCCQRYRIPQPLRLAHQAAGAG